MTAKHARTVTVEQAAQEIGISRSSAYAAIKRGELPVIRFGRRVVVSREVLDRILAGESVRRDHYKESEAEAQ